MDVIEIDLEDEMTKEMFIRVIKDIYPSGCYIYALIPENENELLSYLPESFVRATKIKMNTFPKSYGVAGYINDINYEFVYYFYEYEHLIEYVFSASELTANLFKELKSWKDLYSYFEEKRINHLSMGPDQQWLLHYT